MSYFCLYVYTFSGKKNAQYVSCTHVTPLWIGNQFYVLLWRGNFSIFSAFWRNASMHGCNRAPLRTIFFFMGSFIIAFKFYYNTPYYYSESKWLKKTNGYSSIPGFSVLVWLLLNLRHCINLFLIITNLTL